MAGLSRRLARWRRRRMPYVPGNEVKLLVNGNEIFAAMLSAILTARRTVDVEMYIWRDDAIGQRFANLLAAKSSEGVRVRVIYDSFGCLGTPGSFWRRLTEAGAQVAEFNPVAPWRARRWAGLADHIRSLNHRDHRKIVLVDNELGFAGGMNIGDEYVGRAQDERHWRDTCVEVRGPVVARLATVFERQWRLVTGAKGRPGPVPCPPPAGNHAAAILDSRPWQRTNLIRREMLRAINRARREVEITMAYFMPPRRFVRALRRAVHRGVRVALVLPARSDVPAVYYAGRSRYGSLLRAGVQVFECLGTVLHAKSMQVDGAWATVGSANLDLRSFRLNDELNVFVRGGDFATQVHRAFQHDLARSRQVTLADWKRRPWTDKLRERFYRLFRWWL